MELQQTRPCNGENCGGNIFTSSYDANNNDMFEQNFGEDRDNQNTFQPTKFNRKSFGKNQQPTNWRSTDSQEEQTQVNYDGSDNNMNSYDENTYLESQIPNQFDSNYDRETEDVKNINGNEKLIGSNYRRPFMSDRKHNTNVFGDLESNFDRRNNQKSGSYLEKKRTGYNNSPNTYYNARNPFGFKTIESVERDQQKNNFCLEKPTAPTRPCNKKRPIVKNYWFYDADDGECKLFTADNCDDNRNKFLSMEKCLETCSNSRMEDNQDTNLLRGSYIGGYNNREFGSVTTQPPFRSRWH